MSTLKVHLLPERLQIHSACSYGFVIHETEEEEDSKANIALAVWAMNTKSH